jgi:hypothetical protein
MDEPGSGTWISLQHTACKSCTPHAHLLPHRASFACILVSSSLVGKSAQQGIERTMGAMIGEQERAASCSTACN